MTGFNSKREAAADKLQEPEHEALKLALEALEAMQMYAAAERKGLRICDEAIITVKEALAQPAQEPDWEEQYEYQKRRAEMWIAKYEKNIGPLEKAQPDALTIAYQSGFYDGKKSARARCIELVLAGSSMPVQTKTLEALQRDRKRIAKLIEEDGKP